MTSSAEDRLKKVIELQCKFLLSIIDKLDDDDASQLQLVQIEAQAVLGCAKPIEKKAKRPRWYKKDNRKHNKPNRPRGGDDD